MIKNGRNKMYLFDAFDVIQNEPNLLMIISVILPFHYLFIRHWKKKKKTFFKTIDKRNFVHTRD